MNHLAAAVVAAGTMLGGALATKITGGSLSSEESPSSHGTDAPRPLKEGGKKGRQQTEGADEQISHERTNTGAANSSRQREEAPWERRARIADETLRAIAKGSFRFRDEVIHLRESIKNSEENTRFYPDKETCALANWKDKPTLETQSTEAAAISVLNITTLDAARILHSSYRFQRRQQGYPQPRTGVLNFASATKPGGGFENGAEAQEESIARVSTLIRSLRSREGRRFYDTHQNNRQNAYYTHSIIFSPEILVFRNDMGDSVDPFPIDVVSSAAVNAGLIVADGPAWKAANAEIDIEAVMLERMGRILYTFELHGIRNIVLGTFGTGVFKNKIDMVARTWARLLVGSDSRFRYSFDRVMFAVTGDHTFAEFKGLMEGWFRRRDESRPARGFRPTEGRHGNSRRQ